MVPPELSGRLLAAAMAVLALLASPGCKERAAGNVESASVAGGQGGWADIYAACTVDELDALLEMRKATALALQEVLLDELDAQGRFEERLEPGAEEQAPHVKLPSNPDILGVRLQVLPAESGRLVRTTVVPRGHDPVLDGLVDEIEWLMDRIAEVRSG